jgi:uncharacterized lipoprotein YbaY
MTTTVRILSMLSLGLALTGCGKDSPTTPSPAQPVATNGITVISPNGGEYFKVGGSIRVSWSSTNNALSSTRLMLSCDNTNWADLTKSSVDKAAGDTTLTVPDSVYSSSLRKNIAFPTSSACKVKVQDYVVQSNWDLSDAAFTVTP